MLSLFPLICLGHRFCQKLVQELLSFSLIDDKACNTSEKVVSIISKVVEQIIFSWYL